MKVRIGIQGEHGSSDKAACKIFMARQGWKNHEILYLITTRGVLMALEEGKIHTGTFAYKTTRSGIVEKSRQALRHYSCTIVDQVDIELQHALLCNSEIDPKKLVYLASQDHAHFLEAAFRYMKRIPRAIPQLPPGD